ncbi:uncharacterized protein [Mytilus edulis]|uniref:uncharacterized protein n=1 Tax=Mytilus edulis TaxID=6550 RepID=UPI0039EE2B3C
MKMLLLYVLSISLFLWINGSSSVGSDSESLLTCSKFHFEEKVLEKLVRLEHKMEINEEKMKIWENAFSAKLDRMDKAIKQTETFVKSIRESYLRELSRLNDSFLETVGTLKIQSNNETNIYGEEMHTMLESLSSKTTEFIVAEENRKSAHELMQYTIHQEQKRFNQSFDRFLENTKHTSNKTIHEMFGKQQKGLEASTKRDIVAFSAYRISSQTLSSNKNNFKFDNVWTNIGNGYNPSTGVFTAPLPGVYHFSVVGLSVNNKDLYLRLVHNNDFTSQNLVSGDGVKTGMIDVVFHLQRRDTVSVRGYSGHKMYSDSTFHGTYSGYLIA